ncbi:MAG: DUF1611 domain-containing protein [Candidatus Anammoximicrobium sp.]|nr:DUF1611 domain-containing protein [Candidatus Anammoximicrobium sp.]
MSSRRFIILTEGYANPLTAKTAVCVLRYCPDEVVALLDSTQAGQTSREVFGVGDVPFVADLAQAPDARTLLVGIANPGGKIPPAWRRLLLQAIDRGLDIVSGMHEFLGADSEFAAAAAARGVRLIDVRQSPLKRVSAAVPFRPGCLRVHTVGQDCSVGKMVTSVEITRELKRRGGDAKFAATGQTGIIVEGDGYPIDCMVADFISGAAEQLVLDNQHHEFVVIEGQGSLVHPFYSGVTLGLLHGCQPQGLIFCYEAGRTAPLGASHIRLPSLAKIMQLTELAASVYHPCRMIGISMNSRRLSAAEAEAERDRVGTEFGLPVCDVFRHGPGELADAVLRLKQDLEREARATDAARNDPAPNRREKPGAPCP